MTMRSKSWVVLSCSVWRCYLSYDIPMIAVARVLRPYSHSVAEG